MFIEIINRPIQILAIIYKNELFSKFQIKV